jgi:hypothetical protein
MESMPISVKTRAIAGQIVEMIQITAKVLLTMKVYVESQKSRKIDIEVFGRGKIRVAYESVWILGFGGFHKPAQEGASVIGSVPAHDLRWNLVADEVSEYRCVSPASFDASDDGLAHFGLNLPGIQK